MSQSDIGAPPGIVEHAESASNALIAFIGQELEAWGFEVHSGASARELRVRAGDLRLVVTAEELG